MRGLGGEVKLEKQSGQPRSHDFSTVFRLVLIAGLGVSFTSMGLGLFFLALRPGTPVTAIPLSRLPERLARGEPAAFLNLGLLSLMVTPMARVAAGIAACALARDWIFFALTTVVFLLLLFSFILGVG